MIGAALLITALVSSPVAAGQAASGMGATPEALHRALREHALHTLDGRTLTIGSLRGQVVVVNFWATWCPPCRKELPALAALHNYLAGQGAMVLAVSIDEDLRNVQRFARANRLTLPLAHDGPDGLARQLDLRHVPFTMVLDRNGDVALTATGAGASEIARVSTIARQLAAQKPSASEVRSITQTVEGTTP